MPSALLALLFILLALLTLCSRIPSPPPYTLTPVLHASLPHPSMHYHLLPSITIHDGDSYPFILTDGHTYYSLNGYNIGSMQDAYVSSAKNQYTYLAQIGNQSVTDDQVENITVSITKLQTSNKKPTFQHDRTLAIPSHYGTVTAFAYCSSVSVKTYAFATALGHVLFYRADHTLENSLHFTITNNSLQLTRIGNTLLIHSYRLAPDSCIYSIASNARNSTLQRYQLPKYDAQLIGMPLQIKTNDNNYNQFYVKLGARVYVYQLKGATTPVRWYSLVGVDDGFWVAGSMLVMQLGHVDSAQRFYYNMSDRQLRRFPIPAAPCPSPSIALAVYNSQTNILCAFCPTSHQCYLLRTGSQSVLDSENGSGQYSDFSKFRVPLVLVSLGVVIYISVSRGRKRSGTEDRKEEQEFMKELEKKDRGLYEELKRSRKGGSGSGSGRGRGRLEKVHEEEDEGEQTGALGDRARMKHY